MNFFAASLKHLDYPVGRLFFLYFDLQQFQQDYKSSEVQSDPINMTGNSKHILLFTKMYVHFLYFIPDVNLKTNMIF